MSRQIVAAFICSWLTLAGSIAQANRDAREESTAATAELHAVGAKTSTGRARERGIVRLQAPKKPIVTEPALLPVVDRKDIRLRHRLIADEVLRLFPAFCREKLQTFSVLYDNPSRRGLGGKSTIILSGLVTDTEFRALMIHEMGHVFDLGCLTGTAASGKSEFRDGEDLMMNDDPSVLYYRLSWTDEKTRLSDSRDSDFVSGYAVADVYEDFAEAFALYLLQPELFAKRAEKNPILAAKFQWMRRHVPVVATVAVGGASDRKGIPWDVTKLPYTWIGATTLAQR